MRIAELFDVSDLSVVVTGAASGIGLGYAEAMAYNGARVTMIDMNASNSQFKTCARRGVVFPPGLTARWVIRRQAIRYRAR